MFSRHLQGIYRWMYRTATNADRSRPKTKHPRPIPTTAPANNRADKHAMTLFKFHQTPNPVLRMF